MMQQLRRMVVVGILFSILTVNVAYASAPVWKGGTGALCIILKKGDKASIVNREIYQKR